MASSSSRPQVGLGSFPEETFSEFFHVWGTENISPSKEHFAAFISESGRDATSVSLQR